MRLGYSVIYVADVEASVKFYEAAFGLRRRMVKQSGEYAEMETGGTLLAFSQESTMTDGDHNMRPNRPANAPCAAEVAFITEDVQAAYDRALAAGAISHMPPHQEAWGQTMAHVRDINGFLVELCSPYEERDIKDKQAA